MLTIPCKLIFSLGAWKCWLWEADLCTLLALSTQLKMKLSFKPYWPNFKARSTLLMSLKKSVPISNTDLVSLNGRYSIEARALVKALLGIWPTNQFPTGKSLSASPLCSTIRTPIGTINSWPSKIPWTWPDVWGSILTMTIREDSFVLSLRRLRPSVEEVLHSIILTAKILGKTRVSVKSQWLMRYWTSLHGTRRNYKPLMKQKELPWKKEKTWDSSKCSKRAKPKKKLLMKRQGLTAKI